MSVIKKDLENCFVSKDFYAFNVTEKILNNKEVIKILSKLLAHSKFTYIHSINTGIYAMRIGIEMGADEIYDLVIAALLHDVGKMFIDNEILDKKSRLTNDEFELIQTHSYRGAAYLQSKGFNNQIVTGVLQHHEKLDGTGYPYKITKEQISPFGKIITVADVYDAITSNRPYHAGLTDLEAIAEINKERKIKYDIEVIEALIRSVILNEDVRLLG